MRDITHDCIDTKCSRCVFSSYHFLNKKQVTPSYKRTDLLDALLQLLRLLEPLPLLLHQFSVLHTHTLHFDAFRANAVDGVVVVGDQLLTVAPQRLRSLHVHLRKMIP